MQIRRGSKARDDVERAADHPFEHRLHARGEDGLGEGERIVVRANFLIDSESNLRSALGAFAPPAAKTQ